MNAGQPEGAYGYGDILSVLQSSFASNRDERLRAEGHLSHITAAPGCIEMLLQFVEEPQASKEIKQAATIAIKNAIRERWDPRPEGKSCFAHQDKELARRRILGVLFLEADTSIRGLLAECVKEIAMVDYPERWQELLPMLMQQMRTGEPLRVLNAMLAMRKLVKMYEFKPKEKREPLQHIVATAFPLLQQMCATLLPNESREAAEVLRLILKTLWSATQFQMPGLRDPAVAAALNVPAWFDLLCVVMAKPVAEQQHAAREERDQWPWWKLKKWACQIAARFYSRYGNPNSVDPEVTEFARQFSATIAPKVLQHVMTLLALRPSGQFCTDRVVHSCLCYVDSSVELASTYRLIKPHLDFLLFQVAFPLICLSQEDLNLFETDPLEYVHKHSDPMEDYLDPKAPAVNLVVNLAKFRPKDTLPRLLHFLTEVLNRFVGPAQEGVVRDYREKDGALVALGALGSVLKQKKEYRDSLEALLMQHVLPEFENPLPFMRSRACWIMQHYVDIEFTRQEHLHMCLHSTLRALRDPSLPVQIEAATALRHMINLDGTEGVLLPLLPQILDEYFRIMREVGSDLVVMALEVIIERFQTHIGPHAVKLSQKLSEYFLTYASEGSEDDEAALAAGQCIEALATVLSSVRAMPELFPEMERYLMPMLQLVLSNDGDLIEYLENALDVMTYLTYYGPSISPHLWTLFLMMYDAFDHWAYDYVLNMASAFDNYISRGTDVLLGPSPRGVPYVELVLGMAKRVLSDARQTEKEQKVAAQLLMSILHNCKGRVDQYLPAILTVVLSRIQAVALLQLKLTLLEVLSSAFYYSPVLTFEWMRGANATQQLLGELFRALQEKQFKRYMERKNVALALSSFLAVPSVALPADVAANLSLVVVSAVSIVRELHKDDEKEQAEDGEAYSPSTAGPAGEGDGAAHPGRSNGDGGGMGAAAVGGRSNDGSAGADEAAEFEEGFDENEDVPDEAMKASMGVPSGGFWASAGLDDDYFDDDLEYSSPLDEVDPLSFFYATFRSAYTREPQLYGTLEASLPEAARRELRELLEEGAQAEAQGAGTQGGAAPSAGAG